MAHPSVEFPGPTPQLVVADAARAVHFYRDVFDADELVRNHAPDGRIMHCELLVLGGRLIVVDDFDADPISSPTRLGGTTVRLHVYVSDVDEVYAHALAAGATGVAAPDDAFWGDRYAMLRDPFGHLWSLASVREDLTVAELEQRADTWSAERAGMSGYDDKPWLARYDDGQPASVAPEYETALDMFLATVARVGDGDAIRYFGRRIGFRELDALTDAFAAGITAAGFRPGERVAIFVQNMPQFVIAQLGTWKAGGIAVSVNPMNKARELAELLADSGAAVLVALRSLYRDVAADVVAGSSVRTVITTSEFDFRSGDDPVECPDTVDLLDLLARHAGAAPPDVRLTADDIAFLTYTSGTTGPPKGAMTTHRNVVFTARTYRDWIGIGADDVVLGVAPLFHITGLIGHVAVSLLTGAPLVLMYRFDPGATIDTIAAERATFTVGSITVFIALLHAPNADRAKLASLTKVYSGGAPIPPSTVTAFREKFGHYIHNIYGLTETTSPSHAVPLRAEAPVDPVSGALSVGVPVYDTVVRVVDEHGRDVPPGEVGELATSGPQVVAGYWHKPEETAKALPGGVLLTGDVGYMDEQGWFYLVDRKKDQINAGGYKVWPREVEDVLYEHPAVREAAVVGVPDEYRGETVKAFVSLRAGAAVTPDEVVAFAKERMAAYKYPRQVEILAEIPKTVSGKILRRELRARARRPLAAEQRVDLVTRTELFRGREIELVTGRVLLHAVAERAAPICGHADVTVTDRPWDADHLPHLRRCPDCVALAGGPSPADPRAADVDVRAAHGTDHELAGVAALRAVLAEHDLRRWMFTDVVTMDETIRGGVSHPLTLDPTRILRRPMLALTTFLHEQLHWLDGPGVDSATAEVRSRWPNPPSPAEGGAADETSTWLHLVVCALEHRSLSELVGQEAAAAELAGHAGYAWIYGRILADPTWFADFLHRHGLTVPESPPIPRRCFTAPDLTPR